MQTHTQKWVPLARNEFSKSIKKNIYTPSIYFIIAIVFVCR